VTIEVRRARPDDLDVLLGLVEEYCAADDHVFDAAVARAGLEPLLADDALGTVWMIAEDDGYAVVTWGWSIEIGGLDVVLDELYVRTRGRGAGSAAVAAIEADCRARGVKRIFLETERRNEAARRLYARLGFTVDDSIWMSKELT
jgi:GNAT superfamily N-acetyltransferase